MVQAFNRDPYPLRMDFAPGLRCLHALFRVSPALFDDFASENQSEDVFSMGSLRFRI